MAKSHRGKPLRELPSKSRGTCPTCQRTGVKLLYDRESEDGTKQQICKICFSHFKK